MPVGAEQATKDTEASTGQGYLVFNVVIVILPLCQYLRSEILYLQKKSYKYALMFSLSFLSFQHGEDEEEKLEGLVQRRPPQQEQQEEGEEGHARPLAPREEQEEEGCSRRLTWEEEECLPQTLWTGGEEEEFSPPKKKARRVKDGATLEAGKKNAGRKLFVQNLCVFPLECFTLILVFFYFRIQPRCRCCSTHPRADRKLEQEGSPGDCRICSSDKQPVRHSQFISNTRYTV